MIAETPLPERVRGAAPHVVKGSSSENVKNQAGYVNRGALDQDVHRQACDKSVLDQV